MESQHMYVFGVERLSQIFAIPKLRKFAKQPKKDTEKHKNEMEESFGKWLTFFVKIISFI